MIMKIKILSNAKIYVRGIDLLCFDKINIADPEVYGAGVILSVVGVMVGLGALYVTGWVELWGWLVDEGVCVGWSVCWGGLLSSSWF